MLGVYFFNYEVSFNNKLGSSWVQYFKFFIFYSYISHYRRENKNLNNFPENNLAVNYFQSKLIKNSVVKINYPTYTLFQISTLNLIKLYIK